MSGSRSDSQPTQPLPESFDRRHVTHARPYSIWDAPQAVKRIFSRFPLASHSSEPQPAYLSRLERSKRNGEKQVQFWSNTLSENSQSPSYNVNCLKYQAYLAANDIPFHVVRTTSDGAPDGRLPFLLTPEPSNKPARIVKSTDLEKFVRSRQRLQESGDERQARANREAEGMGLLDKDIRAAWLYSCYLTPENFRSVVFKLYVASVTHASLSHYLMLDRIYSDAKEEFNKLEPTPDIGRSGWRDRAPRADRDFANVLYKRAGIALNDLAIILDGRTFFSGSDQPDLLDCAVFAYTYLTTTSFAEDIRWADARLGNEFRKRAGLMRHMEAVHEYCFGSRPEAPAQELPQEDLQESQHSYADDQTESSRFSVINESAYQESQQSYEHLTPSSWAPESQANSAESLESALPDTQAESRAPIPEQAGEWEDSGEKIEVHSSTDEEPAESAQDQESQFIPSEEEGASMSSSQLFG